MSFAVQDSIPLSVCTEVWRLVTKFILAPRPAMFRPRIFARRRALRQGCRQEAPGLSKGECSPPCPLDRHDHRLLDSSLNAASLCGCPIDGGTALASTVTLFSEGFFFASQNRGAHGGGLAGHDAQSRAFSADAEDHGKSSWSARRSPGRSVGLPVEGGKLMNAATPAPSAWMLNKIVHRRTSRARHVSVKNAEQPGAALAMMGSAGSEC